MISTKRCIIRGLLRHHYGTKIENSTNFEIFPIHLLIEARSAEINIQQLSSSFCVTIGCYTNTFGRTIGNKFLNFFFQIFRA